MRSQLPKVLHRLLGLPMIRYVVEAVMALAPEKAVVVVGRKSGKAIKEVLSGVDGLAFAVQRRPLGTGNALKTGLSALKGFRGDLIVLNGDTPLIRPETLKRLLSRHRRGQNVLTICSFSASEPGGYGRIIRDSSGKAVAIKEERDLSLEERSIDEVNSGIYLLSEAVFPLAGKIRKNAAKGEYYVTDLFGIVLRSGLKAGVLKMDDEDEFSGINTKDDLFRVQSILRRRIVRGWVKRDVFFIDEERVYIQPSVRIGPGTTIYPNVFIEGETVIGEDCMIFPNVRIRDSWIGDNVVVKDSSVIEEAEIHDNVEAGPFARIRPGSILMESARIGNFVEIKKSIIGAGTKAQHLSYIGDAEIGRDVNVGAGTITCNYDGVKKHRTVIEDGVFIGSDSQLVAPVRIGKGAYVGAGSTITRDVRPESLALTRSRQKEIRGWARKKSKKAGRKKRKSGS
jgi:bifunctional UDP-N-acetylglucosamine pyrophosphorylase/glucosamine-1-phosphate N-acetyltransferase